MRRSHMCLMRYSLPRVDVLDKPSVVPDSISAKCNARFVRQVLTSVFIEVSMFTFFYFPYICLHFITFLGHQIAEFCENSSIQQARGCGVRRFGQEHEEIWSKHRSF